jgi:hypothetical protein
MNLLASLNLLEIGYLLSANNGEVFCERSGKSPD